MNKKEYEFKLTEDEFLALFFSLSETEDSCGKCFNGGLSPVWYGHLLDKIQDQFFSQYH